MGMVFSWFKSWSDFMEAQLADAVGDDNENEYVSPCDLKRTSKLESMVVLKYAGLKVLRDLDRLNATLTLNGT